MTPAIAILTETELATRAFRREEGFGSLETERGHLPLLALEVDAQIVGLTAAIKIEQRFKNNFDQALEATYVFPLPDRAGVTAFRMTVNGRVIEGELKPRGEARRAYTQAIAEGRRAAISEEERPNVFSLRVGNLAPGEVAQVHFELTGPLSFDDGEATFHFPLVVAPRYMPGRPLDEPNVGDGTAPDTDQVPDASRISPPVLLPNYPHPVALGLRVAIDPAGHTLSRLRSSLHAVNVETHDGRTVVRLAPGARPNRDFILRFALGSALVEGALRMTPDPAGTEGTFSLSLLPPEDSARAQRPRDVIFLLDRSGSMGGWKMVAARRAVARMVDSLAAKDRFQVFAFDDQMETPADGLVAGNDQQRYAAVEFLAKLEARGGTELAAPLTKCLALLRAGHEAGREQTLVLVTDGQVGNEDQLLEQLGSELGAARVFTIGIDRAVNLGFLNRLAQLGGGSCQLVESEDRLDEVMDLIHRRIATPLYTNLSIAAEGVALIDDSLVPARIPDLFAGLPLAVCGRFTGPPGGAIVVRGEDALGKTWSRRLETTTQNEPALTTLWARGQVRALEDRFVAGTGDRDALEQRIVALSLSHRVLCRFTAFVAVDREERRELGALHRLVQPVEPPDGWAMLGAAGGAGAFAVPRSAPSGMPAAMASPAHYGAMADDAGDSQVAADLTGDAFGENDASFARPAGPSPKRAPAPMAIGASFTPMASSGAPRGGLFSRVRAMFRDEVSPSVSDRAYRQRVREARSLFEGWMREADSSRAKIDALLRLLRLVTMLLEDLAAQPAATDLRAQLTTLSDALRSGLDPEPAKANLERLITETQLALRTAGGDGP